MRKILYTTLVSKLLVYIIAVSLLTFIGVKKISLREYSRYYQTKPQEYSYSILENKLLTHLNQLRYEKNVKTLTYRCHEPPCGGLGDRLKGVIMSFYMSLLLKRRFNLRWDFPHPISPFFEFVHPEFFKFLVSEETVRNSYVEDFIDDSKITSYEDRNFTADWNNIDQVEIRINLPFWKALLSNQDLILSAPKSIIKVLRGMGVFEMANFALKFLFRPSARLQEDAKAILEKMTTNDSVKVGVQLRLGDSYISESYKGSGNKHALDCIEKFSNKIAEICLVLKKKCHVFLTTDAQLVKRKLTSSLATKMPLQNFRIYQTEGQARHSDKPLTTNTSKENYTENKKTYLDWIILTDMDFLVISRSGFGETASWMSGKTTFAYRADLNDFIDFREEMMDKQRKSALY